MAERKKPRLSRQVRELPNYNLQPPANAPLSQEDANQLAESAVLSGASYGSAVISSDSVSEILNSFGDFVGEMRNVASQLYTPG